MKNKFSIAMSVAVILAILLAAGALADQLHGDDLDALGNTTKAPGETGTAGFYLKATGPDGCNADSTHKVTITVTSDKSWLTIDDPATVLLSGCDTASDGTNAGSIGYSLSSSAPDGGVATIKGTASGGKTGNDGYKYDNASFTVTVVVPAPSDSTPPVITADVTGTTGSNSWYVSDVTVVWNVVDNESSISSSAGCDTTTITADTTGTTLTCEATSAGGTASKSVTIKRDATPPTVTATPSRLADSNGWYSDAFSVHFSATDATSDNVVCDADKSYSGPDNGSASITGSCKDAAGNTGSATFSFKYDATAPTIAASISPTDPASTGWYNLATGAPTISYLCDDAGGSGFAPGACPANVTLSNGANQSVYAKTVTDLAGNTSDFSDSFSGINVDLIAPTISASISPDKAETGWYNIATGAPTVSFTCNDKGSSGLAGSCPEDVTLASGADQSVSGGPVFDVAGNSSTVATIDNIDVDLNAPTFSCAVAPANWSATDVTRACSASDTGGSNLVSSATFSLSTNVPADTEDVNASTNSVTVSDNAGNSVTAGPLSGNKVDKKAPQLSSCDSPDGLWHAADVTLYCHYTDGGSGPATQNVVLSTSVAADTEIANAFASANGAKACDNVGNCAASPADISGNKIDKKAPTLTCADAPIFILNQPDATVSAVVTDDGSGPASSPVTAIVPTSSVGSLSASLTGYDNVGHSTTASCSYNVHYNFSGFLQPINDTAHFVGLQTSIFKGGSTVPAKFQLFDYFGHPVQAAAAPQWLTPVKGSSMTASVDESVYSDSPTSGNLYRWDSTAQQYIYNWSTKGVTTGAYWRIGVKFDDGTTYFVNIGLR